MLDKQFHVLPGVLASAATYFTVAATMSFTAGCHNWTIENSKAVGHGQRVVGRTGPLTCQEPDYDFGTRWAGVPVVHFFEVENSGAKDVWVRVVRSATGIFAPRCFLIEAGGMTAIPYWFGTARLSGQIRVSFRLVVVRPPEGRWCPTCGYDAASHPGGADSFEQSCCDKVPRGV